MPRAAITAHEQALRDEGFRPMDPRVRFRRERVRSAKRTGRRRAAEMAEAQARFATDTAPRLGRWHPWNGGGGRKACIDCGACGGWHREGCTQGEDGIFTEEAYNA